MAAQTRSMTVEEFDQFVELPVNAARRFEYIREEVVEVVCNNYSSMVAIAIAAEIRAYIKGKNLGYVTGEAAGYIVAGERYIPDVGFISKRRQPEPCRVAYNPNPPDLAVEVLSPTDDPFDIRTKIVSYLEAETTVWVVDPDKKRVEVYAPHRTPRAVGLNGTLDGGEVLPGFALDVKDIFEE